MQCPTCPEGAVTAFCRNCGKGVCPTCRKESGGVVYCADCVEQTVEATTTEIPSSEPADATEEPRSAPAALPPPPPPPLPRRPQPSARVNNSAPHPVLAGVLGIVPGLGAVYNGQYVKGVIHVVMFGMLLTIASHAARGLEPLFIPTIGLFALYMPIEAMRTAQAVRRGEQVEEMSGLVGAIFRPSDNSPVAGVALIALGILLLLFSLDVIQVEALLPGWPLLIVGYGVYRLYRALRPAEPIRTREEEA